MAKSDFLVHFEGLQSKPNTKDESNNTSMSKLIPVSTFMLLLTACAAIEGGDATPLAPADSVLATSASATAITSTPTLDATLYHTVTVQACNVFEAATIRTLRSQGDMLAWSPVSNTLAYLFPSESQDQSVGFLQTVTFPRSDQPLSIAPHVAGNLSWAPDGKHIAFAVLRLGEGLYSLQAADSLGKGLVDFFPGTSARTDEWASPKIVRRWLDDSTRLEIYASCGVNCAASSVGDVRDGSRKPTGEPSAKQIDLWETHINAPAGEALAILKATHPNWSPDASRIVYVDDKLNVWVVSKPGKNQFILDIGKWATPIETKWSADNAYLAIRTDINVQVFAMDCAPST
jgi:hypothetical protein